MSELSKSQKEYAANIVGQFVGVVLMLTVDGDKDAAKGLSGKQIGWHVPDSYFDARTTLAEICDHLAAKLREVK